MVYYKVSRYSINVVRYIFTLYIVYYNIVMYCIFIYLYIIRLVSNIIIVYQSINHTYITYIL